MGKKTSIKNISMRDESNDQNANNKSTSYNLRTNHRILNSTKSPDNRRRSSRINKSTVDLNESLFDTLMLNSHLTDEIENETFDYASKVNRNDVENAENLNSLENRRSKRSMTKQNLKSKFNDRISERAISPIVSKTSNKKRNLELDDEVDEQPNKKASRKIELKFDYVFIEIQTSGFNSKDEVVKFCCYVQDSTCIGGFAFPKRRMTLKMSELTNIYVGKRIIMNGNFLCKHKDLHTMLCEFVDFLEQMKSDSIVLVYENQFHHAFIPYILINNLRKLNLLERVENKIIGFIDCSEAFWEENSDFLLDLSAYQKKIKSELSTTNPFYRLDILQQYFKSTYEPTASDDESILKFEEAKVYSKKYYIEQEIEQQVPSSSTVEQDDNETLESLREKAQNIIESRDCYTPTELMNLYLLRKLKYQYKFSKTWRPLKKAFPRIEPLKKAVKVSL